MGRSLLPPDVDDYQVPIYHSIFFGQYSEALVRRGRHSDVWFNSNGQYKYNSTLTRCFILILLYPACHIFIGSLKNKYPSQSFDTEIRRRNAPDAEVFADFLRLAFTLDPDQRATCGDLLAHPWLELSV